MDEAVFKKKETPTKPSKFAGYGQQATLFAGGLFLCLMAIVQVFAMGGSRSAQGVSAKNLVGVQPYGAKRRNPDVSFLERVFCKGRRTAIFCSDEVYHPYATWWEDNGEIVSKELQAKHVKGMLTTFQKGDDKVRYSERL